MLIKMRAPVYFMVYQLWLNRLNYWPQLIENVLKL